MSKIGAGSRVAASPAARRLAKSLGVELGSMPGTGRGGRVQADDVRRQLRDNSRVGAVFDELFAKSEGAGPATPFVFLHGFGSDHEAWTGLCLGLGDQAPTLAYDLPGHGRSSRHPCRSTREMAAVVAQDLRRRGHDRINLVGHSMGGAAAFHLALENPELIRSLVLIAPAGFGPEVNHRLLRRFAEASDPAGITLALEQMVGWSFRLPRMLAQHLAAQRRDPQYRERLVGILQTLVDDGEQVRLPIGGIADMPFPVRVIWGTQDRVLPTRQSHKLPGLAATHIFERVGHLPHLEIPREVLKILKYELAR